MSAVFFLKLLILPLLTFTSSIDAQAFQCTNTEKVPPNFEFTSSYTNSIAALQLFTNRKVACRGWLVEWQFFAKNQIIYGLNLGIFRNTTSPFAINPKQQFTFQLVGYTSISVNYIKDYAQNRSIVAIKPEMPIPVEQGDILGAFYNKTIYREQLHTIAYRDSTSRFDNPNTYILDLNRAEVAQGRQVQVDAKTTFKYTNAALTAVVVNDLSETTNAPVTTTTTEQIDESPVPGASTLIPRTTTTFKPNPVKSCLEGENEYVFSNWALQNPFDVRPEAFPSIEAGLHIFEDLQIQCDGSGYITDWYFLIPRGHWLVYGLHLAVFRYDDASETFNLVNSSYIPLRYVVGDAWYWYQLPQEQQLPVQKGDYLGYFYDIFEMGQKLLTIVSRVLDGNAKRTWVYAMNSSQLNETRGQLRLANASITKRQAALLALVAPNQVIRTTPPKPSTTTTTTTQATTTIDDTVTVENSPDPLAVYLTANQRGETACDRVWSSSVVVKYNETEGSDCKSFVGDNLQECEGDLFDVCIDSSADCSTINGRRRNLHKTNVDCYKSVDSYFTSCTHLNVFGERFCSTVITNALSCYDNNDNCLTSPTIKATTAPRRAQLFLTYLNVKERGRTECSDKRNSATVKVFGTVSSCQTFRGDNLKGCAKEGVFRACVDSLADCQEIGAQLVGTFTTTNRCFTNAANSSNSCIHLDGDNGIFCSTFINNDLGCFISNANCKKNVRQIVFGFNDEDNEA